MFFSARRHNALVRRAEQFFPIRVIEEPRAGRPHPWQIRPFWFKSQAMGKDSWRASVEPGLVNAFPPTARMPYGDAPAEARERIRLAENQAGRPEPGNATLVDVFLDEGATLAIPWRRVGAGANPNSVSGNAGSGSITGTFEPVPEFFKARGVRDANPDLLVGDRSAPGQRYLAAADLVLNQPRIRITSSVGLGAVVDGVLVSVNPGFLVPPDLTPNLFFVEKHTPAQTALSVTDIFFNRFIDAAQDTAHLATLYALSPPDIDPGSPVDATWSLFPLYRCHWNLAHAARTQLDRVELAPLVLFTALAGGIADFLMNAFLAANNDFAQVALDFFNNRRGGGSFWAV